jgi:hypothetical protein
MSEFILLDIDSSEPFYQVEHTLSGINYKIKIQWNVQNEFWTISLYTSDDIPIIEGQRIVINYSLFSTCSNPLLPPGLFYAIDESETNEEPGEEDLGNRIKVLYLEP